MNLNVAQKDIILQHLLEGKSISQAECQKLYGFIRLGALIKLLRKEGFIIEDYNTRPKYSEYYIDKDSKYAIQDMVIGDLLRGVNLETDVFTWCDGDDYELALYLRPGLFKLMQLLRKDMKMKICVCEQKEA